MSQSACEVSSKRGQSPSDMTLENQCCSQYRKLLQSSEVLTEDDAKFLSDCIYSGGLHDASNLNLKTHLMQTIGRLVIPGVALAACLAECLLGHSTISTGFVWAVESATASGLAIYCSMEAASVWSSSRKSWQHTSNTAGLKAFIKCCEAYNDLLKKAVRLIQELEIVARGFTLVLPSTPVAKLELSSHPAYRAQQQCPALRMTVFHAARDVAVAFQDATLQLLRKYDLKSSVDHHSHYIASLPLSQFDPLLSGSEATNPEKDQQMGSYSLTSIKAVWQLSCLLQSEYFRRLGLCLCPELHGKGISEGLSIFYNLLSHTTVLLDILETKSEAVKQSYQFHTSVGLTRSKSMEPHHCKKKLHQPEAKSHRLQLAVHSLTLHLQSALTRAASVESDLELNEITGPEGLYDSFSHQLQSVRAELEACGSCLDESSLQLDILYGKVQAKEYQKWSHNRPVSDVVAEGNRKPIPLFELGDPVIEDQVFEACVASDAYDLTSSEDEEFVTDVRANMEKYNQEKENSRKMFKELKSILTMKAREWQEREAKALQKVKSDKYPVPPLATDKKAVTDSDSAQYLSSPGETDTSTDSAELLSGKSDVESNYDGLKNPPAMDSKATNSPLELNINDTYVITNGNDIQETCSAISKDTKVLSGSVDRSPSNHNLSMNLEQHTSLGFAANIAAMAAARSLNFSAMASEIIHAAEAEEFGSDADSDDATNQEL